MNKEKMRTMKKEFLTQLICVMLLTAAAFALTACGDKAGDEEQQSEPSSQTAEQKAADVSDRYSNRVARQPEAATMEAAGMKLTGFTALYSSEDGTATITHHDYIEVIDDITYHFVCEYVSSASGGQHEDETTYFEFMHAIESFKVKGV